VCAIGEERLSKRKGEYGFPYRAVRWVMECAGVEPSDVDAVCISMRSPTIALHTADAIVRADAAERFPYNVLSWLYAVRNRALYAFPALGKLYPRFYRATYVRLFEKKLRGILNSTIQRETGIDPSRIMLIDEHEHSHAYATYWGLRNEGGSDDQWLSLTSSGYGDEVCATVARFQDGELRTIANTPNGSTLGIYFTETTNYFGMKLNEHEYKIMGLAPYAEKRGQAIVYDRLKDIVQVDGMRFTSRWFLDTFVMYPFFKKQLERCRFDWIAGGVQQILEDKLCEWIRNIVKETGFRRFYVSGGVFMNIKAIKSIIDMPEVEKVVAMPTASDESTCFGAAYWAYREKSRQATGKAPSCELLTDLYLGPSYDDDAIAADIEKHVDRAACDVRRSGSIEEEVGALLADNRIVARFNGRMEFGARALGNRSILANPSRLEGITVLNEQIKCRDFWMPFACTVLKEREADYVVNPKGIASRFMAIAFDTTERGARELQAGMHPYDKTVRPQFIEEKDNPSYYRIIKQFEKLTGIGGVLNTSFNIHGEPIVCTPEDAISAFKRSGLRYLAIGNYLVMKKDQTA